MILGHKAHPGFRVFLSLFVIGDIVGIHGKICDLDVNNRTPPKSKHRIGSYYSN